MMMTTYGTGFLFWLINIIFDNNGGFLMKVWFWTSKIFIIAPIANLVLLYLANGSYGNSDQVTASASVNGDRKYIITQVDDTTYGYAFGWVFILCVVDFVLELLSWVPINNYYDYVTKIACVDCGGNDPLKMGENGAYCDKGYVQVGLVCVIDTTTQQWEF
jgi:hypothetical protein